MKCGCTSTWMPAAGVPPPTVVRPCTLPIAALKSAAAPFVRICAPPPFSLKYGVSPFFPGYRTPPARLQKNTYATPSRANARQFFTPGLQLVSGKWQTKSMIERYAYLPSQENCVCHLPLASFTDQFLDFSICAGSLFRGEKVELHLLRARTSSGGVADLFYNWFTTGKWQVATQIYDRKICIPTFTRKLRLPLATCQFHGSIFRFFDMCGFTFSGGEGGAPPAPRAHFFRRRAKNDARLCRIINPR